MAARRLHAGDNQPHSQLRIFSRRRSHRGVDERRGSWTAAKLIRTTTSACRLLRAGRRQRRRERARTCAEVGTCNSDDYDELRYGTGRQKYRPTGRHPPAAVVGGRRAGGEDASAAKVEKYSVDVYNAFEPVSACRARCRPAIARRAVAIACSPPLRCEEQARPCSRASSQMVEVAGLRRPACRLRPRVPDRPSSPCDRERPVRQRALELACGGRFAKSGALRRRPSWTVIGFCAFDRRANQRAASKRNPLGFIGVT